MKPTDDIPTGTDLLIEKIDDLIEVIKHLTATIKEDRHASLEYPTPLTGVDRDEQGVGDTEEAICRSRTVRRCDPEPGDLTLPVGPCDSSDRTEASPDSSAGRGTWYSDIAYSDISYSAGTNSTIINREPREYNLNGIRCGIDMGVNPTVSSCRSTEVSNARG